MLSKNEISEFLRVEFPQNKCVVEDVGHMSSTVRLNVDDSNLRPGGTISGPSMMTLADLALYVAILKQIGMVSLSVTTSFSINFLKKPIAGTDIIGECKLLKLGKTLAVGEVTIYSEGQDEPVAHAVGTYSIPPAK